MGGLSKGNGIHADSIISHFEETQHHFEILAVLAIDFDASSFYCSRVEVTESAHKVIYERDCHTKVN